MNPDHLSKWEQLLESVEKKHVPVQFIKKIIIKMLGKKQQTINIQNLLKQGLEPEEVEEVVSRKLLILSLNSRSALKYGRTVCGSSTSGAIVIKPFILILGYKEIF